MAGLRQQVEGVDLLVAHEDLAYVPAHAFVHHGIAAAEPVEDIQRALGKADRAGSARQRAVIVHQHNRHAVLGQVDRGGQAHRAGPYDDDGMRVASVFLPLLAARLIRK